MLVAVDRPIYYKNQTELDNIDPLSFGERKKQILRWINRINKDSRQIRDYLQEGVVELATFDGGGKEIDREPEGNGGNNGVKKNLRTTILGRNHRKPRSSRE